MSDGLQLRIHSEDSRLKRRINHDPQSRWYRFPTEGLEIVDVEHTMHIGVLNQGYVGKCTAEAACEMLASDPFWATFDPAYQATLNDTWTDAFYSDEEVLNGNGPYPPNDEGSDGLTSAKVAQARGLISGYQHTFSTDDALKALGVTPGSWGTLWKSDMDYVNETTGQVRYSGSTRGGHELCIYKIVKLAEQVWFRQSWGAWGYHKLGLGWISFADFDKSLADQGDMTFYVPNSQPAPTPEPPATMTKTFTVDGAAAIDKWADQAHPTKSGRAAADAWHAAT